MAQTWTRAEIRTEWRSLTGRSSTDDISNSTIDDLINDYLQNHFPEEVQVDEFHTDWTQDTAITDDGEYDLAQTVVTVEHPITIDGDAATVWYDKAPFFDVFPDLGGEDYITSPSLAIGSSSASAVANSAFTYIIGSTRYSAAAAETELSGDTLPQSKYGAWLLSIDEDGTITVTEASDNDTGYDTVKDAVDGITLPASDAIMGFVTVIDSDSTFIPGTTNLNASGVTATFTDGNPDLRSAPTDVLIYGGQLYVRPRPDNIYRIESQLTLQRPSALTTDGSALGDVRWGPYIAVRVAQLWLAGAGRDLEAALALEPLVKQRRINLQRKRILQWHDRPISLSY